MVTEIRDIISRSTRATCGLMERQIIVSSERVEEFKKKLKSKGFSIVGTSEPGRKNRMIWFTRAGGF